MFVFLGDVGLVSMGIDADDYTYLSTDIDYIIHAAAYVNLIYPYQVCMCCVADMSAPAKRNVYMKYKD